MDSHEDLEQILSTAGERDQLPSEDLLPLVYDELRSIAAARLRGEAAGQTLQATALVHEAWLRVSGSGGRMWNDRAHFLRVAALEMRRILVKNAERKSRIKRGGQFHRVDFEGIDIADKQPEERILMIDEALKQLETQDPESARIVTLKFFGGLTNHEVAGIEGVNERTIERKWAFARTLLLEIIEENE